MSETLIVPPRCNSDGLGPTDTSFVQVLCTSSNEYAIFFSNASVTNGTAGDQTFRAMLSFHPGKLQIFALFQVYIGHF